MDVFFIIPGISIAQTTWYVPDDFPTIQGAISDPLVVNGDTIIVRPNTYVENIDFLGKAITLKSEYGSKVTIIDGNQAGSVVVFINGEELDSVIHGFTITNGGNTDNGGGIRCDSSSPTITNNNILGNTAAQGGGINCHSSSSAIKNNMVIGNSSIEGGGIMCDESHPTITNNIIIGNSGGHGGGICCRRYAHPTLTNNTIAENSGGYGGGICCDSSTITIINTILWDNDALRGPEIWIGDPYGYGPSTLSIIYSDVKGHLSSVYVEPGSIINWALVIGGDPLFVDPHNHDFHLTWLSPCINRGTNNGAPPTDIDGDPRPCLCTVEMGADEFIGTHPLEADPLTLSWTTGGKVYLILTGGLINAGRAYTMLGSASGTIPGFFLGGDKTMPINWDWFTNIIHDNPRIFVNFFGTLNHAGQGSAQVVVPPIPGMPELTTYYAYFLNYPIDFVSNPVAIEIVP